MRILTESNTLKNLIFILKITYSQMFVLSMTMLRIPDLEEVPDQNLLPKPGL